MLELLQNYFLAFFDRLYRVTDENSIYEIAQYDPFFLLNVFTAFKGNKFYILIDFTNFTPCLQDIYRNGNSLEKCGTIDKNTEKREITNIKNSQNTKRTYGQPSEQLFPKRWPLSNQNNYMEASGSATIK